MELAKELMVTLVDGIDHRAAADFLLLPVETSYFALYGVGRMLRLVDEEKARRGSPLPYGVLLTLFDRRTNHAREVRC